jgi:hypothetical protein
LQRRSDHCEIYEVTFDERRLFWKGKGLGLKLLSDRMIPGIDPSSKEFINDLECSKTNKGV